MIKRVELPPEVARRFFKDLYAFHAQRDPSRGLLWRLDHDQLAPRVGHPRAPRA